MKIDIPKSKTAVFKLLDAISKEDYTSMPQKENSVISSLFEAIEAPTDNCFSWKYTNRIKDYINEDTCDEDLIDNIKANGQKIPATARKVKDDYETICGIRRLYSCKKLNIPIIIAIINVIDKDTLLIRDAANRTRVDIKPYERAMDYHRWVDLGIYKNYREIQDLTGIKTSSFSHLMSLSTLNTQIVKLFGNPINLKQKLSYSLRLLRKNPNNESKILDLIPALNDKNYYPIAIYGKLVKNCSQDDKDSSEETFTNNKKEILFKTKNINGKMTLTDKYFIEIKETLRSLQK